MALPPADIAAAAIEDEGVWLQESFALAQTVVYANPIGPGSGPFVLDDAYTTRAKNVARERVALAGARLARLIEGSL